MTHYGAKVYSPCFILITFTLLVNGIEKPCSIGTNTEQEFWLECFPLEQFSEASFWWISVKDLHMSEWTQLIQFRISFICVAAKLVWKCVRTFHSAWLQRSIRQWNCITSCHRWDGLIAQQSKTWLLTGIYCWSQRGFDPHQRKVSSVKNEREIENIFAERKTDQNVSKHCLLFWRKCFNAND